MKLAIDTAAGALRIGEGADARDVALYSPEGFAALSDLWVKVGWDQKHCYTFSWLGRPIIQLPDDMLRIQEVIWALKPDVVIETGVAHGGSLIYYASIMRAAGKGRVVGVDIEIRPHNRAAIEAHELADAITLIEASSTAPEALEAVRACIRPGDVVLVILDSDHSFAHVSAELAAYAPLVTPGSYVVATDGVMRMVADSPRGKPDWDRDNPADAAERFAAENPAFELAPPPWPFNESLLAEGPTHWPSAWLRRRADLG